MLYCQCCKESQLHTAVANCPLHVPCTELRFFCFGLVLEVPFDWSLFLIMLSLLFPGGVFWFAFFICFGWGFVVGLSFLSKAKNMPIQSCSFSPDMNPWLECLTPVSLSYNRIAAKVEQSLDFLAHLDIAFLFPRAVLVTNSPLMTNINLPIPARLKNSVTHRRKVTKLKA